MKFLRLIRSSLFRKKTRTFLTVGSIMIAFLMFGLLSAVEKAFTAGVDIAGADRLVTIHKVSLIQLLPRSYLQRIRAVEGVSEVSHATWLGGYYKEPRNFIPAFPVVAETYFEIYPEMEIPPDQMQAWLDDRTGMAAGYVVAEKYGWQIGDRIPIGSEIWRQADGSATWEMTLRAIYRPKDDLGDPTAVMMHYDFFNETLPEGGARDMAGWYVIRVDDPDKAAEIAEEIDNRFANSSAETKTSTEKAFAAGFANQVGNIGAIVTGIVTAVFFTMLLVTANTMGQSVRERTNELAVLKTLGFTNTRVTVLVLIESLVITAIGGLLGLGLAWLVIEGLGDTLRQFLPVFYLPGRDLVVGLVLMTLFGLVAGAFPAGQALRLRIADALRKGS
ncbi:MAG: ABC transporter permease [Gammaproteobacteria bacterium]|nr:ABC transporter permease [Gammaproteobacteria bacterium]